MDSILQGIFKRADEHPGRPAVSDKDTEITYKELTTYISAAAKVLKQNGVCEGSCVLVQAVHKVSFVVALFAVHYAGAIFVPIDHKLPEENINSILQETKAACIIADNLVMSSCKVISYDEIMRDCHDGSSVLKMPEATQYADLFFTTGTTGKPKGVLFNHSNLVAVVENLIGGSHMEDGTVYLVYGPLNHVFSVRKIYYTLFCGNTVVLLNGLINIKLFFEMLDKKHVTATHLLPAAAKVLFKLSKDRIGNYADQLVFVESGTAPFAEEDMTRLRELLPRTRLYFGYGCSESDCITKLEYSRYPGRVNCVGRLTVHADVLLVNDDREVINATRNNPGLVACKGPMNMVGYWNEPELTAQVMSDGYVYTNDLGYFDEEGFLYILGRKGDVINVGGIKVAAKEIEELAVKFPGVEDAAVIPIDDPISTQVPKLFVSLEKNAAIDEKELRAFLAKTLETYKLPRVIQVIDAIPRTYNGKIQKNKLK